MNKRISIRNESGNKSTRLFDAIRTDDGKIYLEVKKAGYKDIETIAFDDVVRQIAENLNK